MALIRKPEFDCHGNDWDSLNYPYNAVDNRAAVASVATADLNLVGVAVYADRRVANKILKGLRLLS